MALLDFTKKEELKKIKHLEAELSELKEILSQRESDLSKINDLYLKTSLQNSSYLEQLKPIASIGNIDQYLKYKNDEVNEITIKIETLEREYSANYSIFKKLKEQILLYSEDCKIIDSGLYAPIFNFDTSDEFRTRILQNHEQQKLLIKENKAITSGDDKVYYQHEYKFLTAHYKKSITSYKKLILLGFNSECDALISKAKWNNLGNIRLKIQDIYNRINLQSIEFCGFILLQNSIVNKQNYNSNEFRERFQTHMIQITQPFLALKYEELALYHEFELKKHQEKEEHQRVRELLREEEKARRDFEKARREADAEEVLVKKQLEIAKLRANEDKENYELKKRIQELEYKLDAIEDIRERALSMAQQTKRGYIYVISNIGSFGEDVYKIGMTRRLDPFERVRELGNASVPFKFDVHTMIFSEDAPSLENELHKAFSEKRINQFNQRREFFKLTLDEIKIKFKNLNLEAEFITIPEAREFRETQSILERLLEQTLEIRKITQRDEINFPPSIS